MSTTVDQRVVEMRFDNKQFEINVKTSMSTLDKLKQSLNLSGAAKGLAGIGSAAKKVSFTGMASGIETVQSKFSALEVMGITALANITNSAVNAGKRIAHSLTIEPISDGFSEYELKLNSVQTIMASTGASLETVNEYLEELNVYADKTIYSFSDMTSNIGKFTNAGVELEDAVKAIQGVSNVAAVSGANANEASRAMYNFAQALSAGAVKLIDWKSIELANMATVEFKNELIKTALEVGTLVEKEGVLESTTTDLNGDVSEAFTTTRMFDESLSHQWMTTEVLVKTLGRYADETTEIGKKAFAAAQDVKTFSQLLDTLKEAVGSGWAVTWELIFGDFNQAKKLWTGVYNVIGGFIGRMSDARNNLLRGALGSPFAKIAEKINSVAEATEKVNKVTKDYGDIVDRVIRGELGHTQERWDKLTEMGYDWAEVQNAVNEKLGSSVRHTSSLSKEQKTLNETQSTTIDQLARMSNGQLENLGLTRDEIQALRDLKEHADAAGYSLSEVLENPDLLNGRTLLINSFKNIGDSLVTIFNSIGEAYTEVFNPSTIDEKSLKLHKVLSLFHKFTSEIATKINDNSENLTRTFKGLFAAIDIVTTIVGGGFKLALKLVSEVLKAFDMNVLDVTANIGDSIVKFREWLFEQNDLTKAIKSFIEQIPEAIHKTKEWFKAFTETPAVHKLVEAIESVRSAFDDLVNGDIDFSKFAISLGTNFAKALKSLPGIAVQIGKDFIAGFQNGIIDGGKGIIDRIVSFCLNFVSAFAEALGVQSPSWKAYEICVDFFRGLLNAIKNMTVVVINALKAVGEEIVETFRNLWSLITGEQESNVEGLASSIGNVFKTDGEQIVNVFKTVGEQIVKVFKSFWDFITDEEGNIEWENIFSIGSLSAMIWTLKKLADAISGITGIISGIADVCESLSDGITRVSKAVSIDMKAKALQRMAIAIGILVASILILASIDDPKKLWQAVEIIVILSGILVGLAVAMDKMSEASVSFKKGEGINIDGLKQSLLQIGIALLLLAVVVKMIGNMNADQARQGFLGLAGLAVGILVFAAVLGKIGKTGSFKDVDKVGKMMRRLAIAMILMITVIKLASKLTAEEALKGAAFGIAFAIFVRSITTVAKSSGDNVSKVGGMILKISIAMALMVGVVKLVGLLSVDEMLKGAAFATAFVLFVKALVKTTKIEKNQQLAGIAGLVLSVSLSLMLMVGVCKLVGTLTAGEMVKGAIFVAAFVILLKVLVKVLSVGNETQMAKVSGTILAMSLAIAILAGVAVLLGLVDISSLAKGITAVGLLSLMMSLMIKSLKGAQNVKGSILMMAIAIGVMAAAVAALSFIEPNKLFGATAALSILMGMFALIAKSSTRIETSVGTMAIMIGVVAALAAILAAMSLLDVGSTLEFAASISLLMMSMAVSLKLISGIGKESLAAVGVMALLGLVVGEIGVILGLMSYFDVTPSIETAGALSILLLAMAGVTFILSTVGANVAGAFAGVASLAIVVAGVGFIIGALGALNEKFPQMKKFLEDGIPILELIGSGLGKFFGSLIGGFVGGIGEAISSSLIPMAVDFNNFLLIMYPASLIAKQIEPSSFDSVKAMIDVFAAIAWNSLKTAIADFLIIGGDSMSQFQDNGVKLFKAMKAISDEIPDSNITLPEGGFDWVSTLIDLFGTISWSSLKTAIADFLIIGGDSMSQFQDNGVKLFKAMKAISDEIPDSNITLPEGGLDWVSTLIDLFGTISWSSLKTTIADFLIIGGDSMSQFQDNGVKFFKAMKAISDEIPDSNITLPEGGFDWVSTLIDLFGTISWSSLKTAIADFLIIGDDTSMSKFRDNAIDFFAAMQEIAEEVAVTEIDTDALQSVIDAATKLVDLQSSLDSIGGVVSWFTGHDDLGTFGENASDFVGSMKTLGDSLGETNINGEALISVIDAATQLSEFQSSLEGVEGVIDWFVGKSDLGTFGTNVETFANAMGTLKTSMGEDGISEDVITSMTNTGTALVELIDTLPEEGWFDGKMNLTDFSDYITDFAEAISDFGSKSSEIDLEAMSTTITAAYRIKNLITSLAGLDTSGVAAFTGIGTGGFGADGAVSDIAKAMADYCSEIGKIDTGSVDTSVSAAVTLKGLISSLVGLDTSGIENFKIESIGTAMKNYFNKVSGMDTTVVSSSVSSANRLKALMADLVGLDSSGIDNFKPEAIASNIKSYADSVVGIDISSISRSISAATKLKNFIIELTGIDSGGVKEFVQAITDLSSVSIDDMVETFTIESPKLLTAGANLIESLMKGIKSEQQPLTDLTQQIIESSAYKTIVSKEEPFKSAGSTLMIKLADGIKQEAKSVSSASTKAVTKAITNIRGYYNNIKNAGSYLGDGLVVGIDSKQKSVYNAGYALGQKAVQGVKDGQKSNSPSKLTIQAGKWAGEGLVLGIKQMGRSVYDAGYEIGDTAAKSMSKSISKISDLIDGGMDTQPTIRPVLDLSDVQSGVGAINGLFGGPVPIKGYADVSSINYSMNKLNQNGANDRVVSAIDKLRKDLGNVRGDSYNINGITYDDGSSMAEAIKAIVREARVERRR